MAIFTITGSSAKNTRDAFYFPAPGNSTTTNINGNIGSTVTFAGGVTSANSLSPFPYSNTSPIYLVYTTQIGNRKVDLAGNVQNPPLNNSITIRGDNRTSLIANGNYNWFTGEFTAPIVDTILSLCPPNEDPAVTFVSQETTTVNGNDGSCTQQDLATYVAPSPTPTSSINPTPTSSAGTTATPTPTATSTPTPTPTPSTSTPALIPYAFEGYHETTFADTQNWWQIYGFRTSTSSISSLNSANGWQGAAFDQDAGNSYFAGGSLATHIRDNNGTYELVDPNNSSIKMPISINTVGQTFSRTEYLTLPTGRVISADNRYYTNTVIGQTLLWTGSMKFGIPEYSNVENAPIYTAGALKKVWRNNQSVGNTIRILGASVNGDFYPNYWWGGSNTISSGDVLKIRWKRTVYSVSGIWADEMWETEYIQGHMPDWCTSDPNSFNSYGVTPLYSMSARLDSTGSEQQISNYLFKKEISVAGDGRSGVNGRVFSSSNWGRQRRCTALDTEGNLITTVFDGFGNLTIPEVIAPTTETLYETRCIVSMEAETSRQAYTGETARYSGSSISYIKANSRFNQVRAASVILTN